MTEEEQLHRLYVIDARIIPALFESYQSDGHLDVEDINGSGQRFRLEFIIKVK